MKKKSNIHFKLCHWELFFVISFISNPDPEWLFRIQIRNGKKFRIRINNTASNARAAYSTSRMGGGPAQEEDDLDPDPE